jgi:hypothetical protein
MTCCGGRWLATHPPAFSPTDEATRRRISLGALRFPESGANRKILWNAPKRVPDGFPSGKEVSISRECRPAIRASANTYPALVAEIILDERFGLWALIEIRVGKPSEAPLRIRGRVPGAASGGLSYRVIFHCND